MTSGILVVTEIFNPRAILRMIETGWAWLFVRSPKKHLFFPRQAKQATTSRPDLILSISLANLGNKQSEDRKAMHVEKYLEIK